MQRRDLSPTEKRVLKERCLYCDGEDFYIGPQGGLSFNIYCADSDCLAGYNVTHEELPWQVIAKPGERTLGELMPILQSSKVVEASILHRTLTAAIDKAMRDLMERVKKN